jgi:arylsulfatase A-like enzyme
MTTPFLVTFATGAMLSLGAAPAQQQTNAATKGRPNILFILVDDQSPFDLKIYDETSVCRTPVIDQLAAEGTVVDGAYHMGSWSGAVCTPSRHMIMTGATVWHLPKRGMRREKRNPLCAENLAQNCMAAIFNRAGYDTMRTCKRGNSYQAANKQFRVVHDKVKRGADGTNGSAWHADRVLDYLQQRETAQDNNPFLIYFGFSHPHDPRHAPKELLAHYGAENRNVSPVPSANAPPLPRNYLPAHPFHHGHPKLRDEVNVQGVKRKRDEATLRNELGRQFACNENIDQQIGRVLARLKKMGELDNTIVIYTSDHGMAIGRHGLQGKQNLYEHTFRVPFVVKGPGIPKGKRVTGNIYLLDLLPTLCDFAGIQPPTTIEGISMRPVLQGKQATVRDVLYGVYAGGSKPGIRCVKQGNWKLIQYDTMNGAVRKTQLFDLASNPDELLENHHVDVVVGLTGNVPKRHQRNLANDPRFAHKRAEMETLLLAEMKRLNDPYRMWNQPDK